MSTITGIRTATYNDIDVITDIHVSSWREVYHFMPASVHELRGHDHRKQQWQDWFRSAPEDEALFVLESGDDVVGFSMAKPNRDPAIDAAGDFHACYIRPAYRGGVAGPLSMMALALFLQETNQWPACVWAFKENKYKRIYPQIGCKAVVFRDRVIGGQAIPEIGYMAPDYDTLMARLYRMYASGVRRQNSRPATPPLLSRLVG